MECVEFTAEQCAALQQMIESGLSDSTIFTFDPELVAFGVLGGLSMWATGAGIGLIINAIRKLRLPS